jgi:hypothetical protein
MGILPARFAPTGIADDLDPRLFCTAIKKARPSAGPSQNAVFSN